MNADEQQAIARTVVNRVADARGLDAPWLDVDADLPGWLADLTSADLAGWGARELGEVRERLATDDERQTGGIWYTPPALADNIARLALAVHSYGPQHDAPGYVLRVLTLDPACGAGVVLVSAARNIAARYAARATGTDPAPAWAVRTVLPTVLTECVYGIDIDPVAVDLARAACWLETSGTREPGFMDDNIIVGDPLAGELPKPLEGRLADPDPLYILGNPPYRDKAKGAAPWIEARRTGDQELFPRPSMDEFRTGDRSDYVLSSLSIFFWRWAIWKALESREGYGTVAFISPSTYTKAVSYRAMREHLRRVASEGWVIDLTPEGHQPPIKTRLFPGVQQPLAIGIFTTHQRHQPDQARTA